MAFRFDRFPLAAVLTLTWGVMACSAAEPLPALTTEVAYPNLSFDRPVALAYPDDDSKLLFVVEQHQGKVFSFPNDKGTRDKVEFMTLPDNMNRDNEEGLLGLAFHPKYKENGQFFLYYSADDGDGKRRSVVSRFERTKNDPRKADPRSEKRVWVSAVDPFSNHNGGCIAFGPDGMLYISLGDSGAGDDPLKTGQDPSDWFASILRIDVDHPEGDMAYGIPKDNPRLRDPGKFSNWAPEVFCIGLRNVWKFTFDKKTGTIWAGDVGQNQWEMVHILQNGGNYGWSVKEATHNYIAKQKKPFKRSDFSAPLVEYPHSPNETRERSDYGQSITGGYVYRGKALPALEGIYVYGDFQSGRIWGLREEGGKATISGEIVDISKQKPLNIAVFGEDRDGELTILAFDGKLHTFVMKP